MANIAAVLPTTINTGDITVDITPPAAGTLDVTTAETLTGFTINADAYKVVIKNVGSLIESGADVAILVDGDTVAPGERVQFDAVLDPALGGSGTFKRLPAITVTNAGGAGVWYQVSR
jgi:hypothetical protein